jgi:hypothetical protein
MENAFGNMENTSRETAAGKTGTMIKDTLSEACGGDDDRKGES